MNIQKAHRLLGHGCKDSMRRTAKQLEWEIFRGKMKPYLHCAKAKARQKNVCKESEAPKAKAPGKRIYLDLSKVTVAKDNGSEFELKKKNWKSIVDEASQKKWCDFTEKPRM